jgi:hypothetical protein
MKHKKKYIPKETVIQKGSNRHFTKREQEEVKIIVIIIDTKLKREKSITTLQ